jgi:hypothetical protein
MWTDERTDMTKLRFAFRNFANASKKTKIKLHILCTVCIVMYLLNKDQQDALLFLNLFEHYIN